MQERRNSIANAMELRLSCTNLSIHFSLTDMSATGILSNLHNEWFGEWLGDNECANTVSAEASSVSLGLLWPGFALLAGGLTLGLLAFLGESLWRLFRERRENQEDAGSLPAIEDQPCEVGTVTETKGSQEQSDSIEVAHGSQDDLKGQEDN